MPGYGGSRPGAGRPRGTRNRRSREALAAAEQGIKPLDFLLSVMWDPAAELAYRLEAAKAAAPYVHPKLSQVQVNATASLNHVTDQQLEQEIQILLRDPDVRSCLLASKRERSDVRQRGARSAT